MQTIEAGGYYFKEVGKPLEYHDFIIDQLEEGQVVVKVAGCGLCHTDISYLTGEVKTNQELPLILGHEISGTVVSVTSAFSHLMSKSVIVPAVLPCGECELCKKERDNICQHQKMPGNDFHGGFASHIVVPGRYLCELPDNLEGFELHQLSIIADAMTTPYQALIRSNLQPRDLAIVIGVGGIGNYMAQHAKNAGATVIALDINEKKLELISKQGADYCLLTKGLEGHEIKKNIRALVKENGLPLFQWKIFETSGSATGQQLAFALQSFAGCVGIIGFTMEKVTIRLSNLMAFDGNMFGNWGCRPIYYKDVVNSVLQGKINLIDNIESHPLDSINDVLKASLEHRLEKRAILIPN